MGVGVGGNREGGGGLDKNWKRRCREYSRISLPIGTNGKPLAAIGKFPNAIGKLMIGKTSATNGEEITNAMIGNAVLAIYW